MNQTTHKCKNCGEEWSPIPHTDSADVCPNCGQPTNDKTPELAEQLAIGVVKDFRRKRIMSYDHDKPDAIRAILSAIQSATQPLERRIEELTAENAELRKDKERLDWILSTRPPHGVLYVNGKGYYAERFDTRQLIDQAIDQTDKR
jgi:predicted  nucleic acid-binding Zn-ribbon protein